MGDMTPKSYSSLSAGVWLDDFIRVAEAYMIQVTNSRNRTGLTGTPLGVRLAIVLFIHKIAFVDMSSCAILHNSPSELP